jgi:hypothetical protein
MSSFLSVAKKLSATALSWQSPRDPIDWAMPAARAWPNASETNWLPWSEAALASIDAIYAIESVSAYNADVAPPLEVQEFWGKHREFPGFAAGDVPEELDDRDSGFAFWVPATTLGRRDVAEVVWAPGG